MGFEDQMIRSIDSDKSREHPVISEMHMKAQGVLCENAFDPRDFIGEPYAKEEVLEDLERVERIKDNNEKNNTQEHKKAKRIAEVLEAILYFHAQQSEWLGPTVKTKRPSEYDDYVNGVDMVAEFEKEDITKYLALGVDVTFASMSMGKKFDRIKEELDNDELAKLKYFESHYHKGGIRQIPRIVVGIEMEKVIELAGLWKNGKNRALGEHIVKEIILTEIFEQLKVYRDYAKRHGKINALKSYNDALTTIRELRGKLKGLEREKKELIESDRVCQSIRDELRRKFSN